MTALLASRIGVACLILALAALVTDHLAMSLRLFAAGMACGLEAECRLIEGRDG